MSRAELYTIVYCAIDSIQDADRRERAKAALNEMHRRLVAAHDAFDDQSEVVEQLRSAS